MKALSAEQVIMMFLILAACAAITMVAQSKAAITQLL